MNTALRKGRNVFKPIAAIILISLACSLPGLTPASPEVPKSTATVISPTAISTNPVAAPTDPPPELTETVTLDEAADIIFYNGVILTMQPGVITTAIAIKDNRIMTLGNDERMLQFGGPETRVIDLDGRTMMPGFVDAHNHLFDTASGDYTAAQDLALSNGITAMAEFFATESLMQDIIAMDQGGNLHLRLSMYPVHIDNCGEVLGPWYLEAFPVSREPAAMLQVPGVKMFNDGGSCNAPAVSYEYPGGAGNGDLYFSAVDLAGQIAEVQGNGYQAAIHSLGDRAIEVTLDAIEKTLDGGPNDFRHRIEHNAVLRDDLFPRFSEVNPVATIFGAFPACLWAGDTSNFKYITPEAFRDWEWAWRPLIDQNPDVHFAWHSDYPVFTINPFEHLFGLVTRKSLSGDGAICDPPGWAADDVLSVDEALRLMTIDATYAIFRENEIGSLAIGKLADLIVISENPLELNPNDLFGITVMMTMVGGETVFCADEAGGYCP